MLWQVYNWDLLPLSHEVRRCTTQGVPASRRDPNAISRIQRRSSWTSASASSASGPPALGRRPIAGSRRGQRSPVPGAVPPRPAGRPRGTGRCGDGAPAPVRRRVRRRRCRAAGCAALRLRANALGGEVGGDRAPRAAGPHQVAHAALGERGVIDRTGGGQSRDDAARGLLRGGKLRGDGVAVGVGGLRGRSGRSGVPGHVAVRPRSRHSGQGSSEPRPATPRHLVPGVVPPCGSPCWPCWSSPRAAEMAWHPCRTGRSVDAPQQHAELRPGSHPGLYASVPASVGSMIP